MVGEETDKHGEWKIISALSVLCYVCLYSVCNTFYSSALYSAFLPYPILTVSSY